MVKYDCISFTYGLNVGQTIWNYVSNFDLQVRPAANYRSQARETFADGEVLTNCVRRVRDEVKRRRVRPAANYGGSGSQTPTAAYGYLVEFKF